MSQFKIPSLLKVSFSGTSFQPFGRFLECKAYPLMRLVEGKSYPKDNLLMFRRDYNNLSNNNLSNNKEKKPSSSTSNVSSFFSKLFFCICAAELIYIYSMWSLDESTRKKERYR